MTGSRHSPDQAPLLIRQPARGYRYSIDAVLLADFAAPLCGRTVLDLGTGVGVVLLLLSRRCPALRSGTGVEIQRELCEFARGNIVENGLSERVAAVHGDFRTPLPGVACGEYDLVVANPPYRRVGEGRRNPDPRKEIARHEVSCTLPELFRAAERHLSPRGRIAMVGLATRVPEILACGAAAGIHASALRFVHPHPDRPANLVLYAGGRRRPPELAVLPPLVVYAEKGRYHPEVEAIYQACFPGWSPPGTRNSPGRTPIE